MLSRQSLEKYQKTDVRKARRASAARSRDSNRLFRKGTTRRSTTRSIRSERVSFCGTCPKLPHRYKECGCFCFFRFRRGGGGDCLPDDDDDDDNLVTLGATTTVDGTAWRAWTPKIGDVIVIAARIVAAKNKRKDGQDLVVVVFVARLVEVVDC